MSRIAVIDVETTGLNPYRHDRIIEIAAVLISPNGKVEREFVSLVNPERDVGPSRIHGLMASDLISAPTFRDIAGELVDVLDGAVGIAGHNVRFDHSFLCAEFERMEQVFPESPRFCTMQLAGGGSLSSVCSDYGIVIEGEMHSAWHDAKATANLMTCLISDAPGLISQIMKAPRIQWPRILKTTAKPLTRTASRELQVDPPSFIQKLLARAMPDIPSDENDSSRLAYTALLDRALDDRHLDPSEAEDLLQVAEYWQISGRHIKDIHWEYLLRLAAAALSDGVITDSERRDLEKVAVLLGTEKGDLDLVLHQAQQKLLELQDRLKPRRAEHAEASDAIRGRRVCFTGECQCYFEGEVMTRDVAIQLAESHGIVVAESVTKKLDILVVADPLTQSGKAKKARKYGIRILHELVFWQAIGVKVE